MANQFKNEYSDKQVYFIIETRNNGKQWEEVAEAYSKEFSSKKSAEAMRKTYNKYKDLTLTNDAYVENMKDTYKAQRNSSLLAKDNRALLTYTTEADAKKELIDMMLKKIKFTTHKPVLTKKKPKKIDRVLLAHLSDLHYGTKVNAGELGGLNTFSPKIAARRTAYFFKQLVEYSYDHLNETELVLVINGDLFAGVIHDADCNELMTNQFYLAVRILGEGISYLANHFSKVTIHATVGNHDRQTGSNKDGGRALTAKWDSHATMSYIALKERVISNKNVKFEIVTTPYADFTALNYRIYATHGDTIFKIGIPSKSINTGLISAQINSINNSDMVKNNKKFDIFLFAHMHTPVMTMASGGEYVFINGSLIGLDAFGQSIGINVNRPTQQFVEITRDHIGNSRFADLLPADNDSSLDVIIPEPKLLS